MGRKAKLRAARNHDNSYIEANTNLAASYTAAAMCMTPLMERIPIFSADAAAVITKEVNNFPASERLAALSYAYQEVFSRCSDYLGLGFDDSLEMLATCPTEGTARDFFALFGYFISGCRALIPAAVINERLARLMETPLFVGALKLHGEGDSITAPSPLIGLLKGALILSGSSRIHALKEKQVTAEEAAEVCHSLIAYEGCFDSFGDIVSGRVLCDADQLVLHYRRQGRFGAGDLCLSYRSPEGMLSFFPTSEGTTPLPCAAIKQLRSFVANYRGPRMAGEISGHPAAARLCTLIGLSVKNGYGFLAPAQ